ncbi:NADP-dependent oxidoreductase [Actinoallomurus bryophytorum]|uniref:NADPH:quinone reductase-like Zn-dependent oxidoreductase n=1 Tax=Actinoallomurus bryophytorum TaxID=1490222 RepID=A0A543CHW3_9ACTN|nr:NADP-dependent oxidoreductase [Actinoallomurus bryophytorum]TQL96703.1 NADPH:quinone reductase-like Zn-dependent oxidoreductase [Actinoallomurus bryophytorum]
MKAVRYATYGGPDVLELVDVEPPHPGPGQIRIAVRAAGVNGIDWKIRAGYMRDQRPIPLPAGTGVDAAGVVDEVGEGVEGTAVGDAVFGNGTATTAEYAVLSHWAAKPAALSFEEAAGYPVPVETAIRIIDQVGVQPGQTLLVSGAAGGVGSATVQIARQRGITVIGTASARNQDYLRELGATATTYGDGLADRVRALAPDGVDAALDIAGSGVIPELVEITGDPAKVVSIADFTAPEHGAQVSFASANQAAAFTEAARLYEEGVFRIPVAKTYPLGETADAQEASAAGHVAGRLVITVA